MIDNGNTNKGDYTLMKKIRIDWYAIALIVLIFTMFTNKSQVNAVGASRLCEGDYSGFTVPFFTFSKCTK